MFTPGEIVYHDVLMFDDNSIDKKINRPCVVLYEVNINNELYICTCPLTSSINSFNKHNKSYVLIPQEIYNYKAFSFAKITSSNYKTLDNTHTTGIHLTENSFEVLKNKILNCSFENLKEIKHNIELNEPIEINKEKNKSYKKEKIRNAKKGVKLGE